MLRHKVTKPLARWQAQIENGRRTGYSLSMIGCRFESTVLSRDSEVLVWCCAPGRNVEVKESVCQAVLQGVVEHTARA